MTCSTQMTTTITDLHILAETLGVTLTHHNGGTPGWYHHPTRTISTRRKLGICDYKSILAHELAHAYYRDEHCGRWNGKQERRADRLAARILIHPDELHDAVLWHRDDLHGLALDLEVTPHLIDVFMTLRNKEIYT